MYTDPVLADNIVDGTIFLQSDDPEILAQVKADLLEMFPDAIDDINNLFPET